VTTKTAKQWVYSFAEGDATQSALLGGKGAGLSEMTQAGMPVPPGFTISTEACLAYYAQNKRFPEGLWGQILAALNTVEQEAGKRFGDPENPLLVSVRSGAKVSMPGMMDTVLNLGLNASTLQGLARLSGNERFAYDSYRRFIEMFSNIVLGIDRAEFEHLLDKQKEAVGAKLDTDLDATALRAVVQDFLGLVQQKTNTAFPSDPKDQLRLAIEAVFASWNNKRAIDYRNFNNIPHDLGTAVNIVSMVFGNLGAGSGTGVAFTRDPSTGEKRLYGEYLQNAQGEDVVAGVRTPLKLESLKDEMPQVYQQFLDISQRLERHYRDAQDMEFTVERGKLYMLQTRSAKRAAAAAVKIAVDMVSEGLISKEEALLRVEPNHIYQLLLPRFDDNDKRKANSGGRLLGQGLNASPGAASGKIVFDPDQAERRGAAGEHVILVRQETNPDDVHGMIQAQGILTARGGATSHAAVVARGLGKPCVAGFEALRVDMETRTMSVNGHTVHEMEEISIDGSTGEVFLGQITTLATSLEEQPQLRTLLSWADDVRRLQVWANADYPSDASRARAFGAEGIGLCRTEHMFFEQERLPIVRQMILSASEATAAEQAVDDAEAALSAASNDHRPALEQRLAEAQAHVRASSAVRQYRDALGRLQKFQTEDFRGILQTMAGLPVIIRLLDPPLHEFLPSHEELLIQVTELRVRGDNPQELHEKEEMLHAVAIMREQNPMLGLRGCRLGIVNPGIYAMQVRAILTAACELTKAGVDVHPEIMIPLVGHANELEVVRKQVERVAADVMQEQKQPVSYKIGTMIEVPRAALTADEIAHHAQFFSFGTNDLTQMTFAYSRDDAEGKFLAPYLRQGVLSDNPFQTLDTSGVGKLITMAVEQGRKTRPDLEIGVCGEHGGDPQSIAFCHAAGLDYVSCSPFRVPIARLAAAQAALGAHPEGS